MKRFLIGAVLAVLAVGGGAFAWLWFSGGSGEPSTELTTPDIAGQTSTTSGNGAGEAFVIDAGQSTASFTLNEVLRGQPKTVVGRTSEVAGQFLLDENRLAAATFSPIVINARTFSTDSATRDRAIRGPIILNSASDEFELITFEIISIDGLEGSAVIGDEVQFNLFGNLTIKGVTQETTFAVSATLVDISTVQGSAVAEVLRSDFGIDIPNVASVADVTDEVTIQLDFVATRS